MSPIVLLPAVVRPPARPARHLPRVLAALLVVALTILPLGPRWPLGPVAASADTASVLADQGLLREALEDYEVVNGYYYTQAGGSTNADQGYTITDEAGIPLWSEFQRLGGVDVLGYPISRRFTRDGFTEQATQKAVLQWRPELGRVVFTNVLDDLTAAGKDDYLLAFRQIPKPASFTDEAGLTFEQVVEKRLKVLDSNAALKAAYLKWSDPVEANGLPEAPITDTGAALVLRTQRRAFQLWKVSTPWASAGDVTVVNAGDLAKEASLYPADSLKPEPASTQIATPPGSNTRLSADDLKQLRAIVEKARPAVVKLTDGINASGTGIILDSTGLILTNSHVVTAEDPKQMKAILPDGRSFPAKPVGADEWTDVAVVRIEAANLPHVTLGDPHTLAVGQRVIGLGYAPIFPGAPSAKTGIVRSLAGELQVEDSYPLFDLIQSNTFLYPGDSGGPLLNLNGDVVGINSAIQVAWVPRKGRQLTGYSVPIDGANQIAQQLIAVGNVPRPQIGITPVDVTAALVSSLALPNSRGVLVADVRPDSPASAAGIQNSDLLVSLDGQTLTGLTSLRRLMVGHKVGDTITLGVISPGQPKRDVQVTLSERPPLV